MTTRDLLGTNLTITSEVGKAFNLDTIVLSDFVRIPKGTKSILDVGCGNGAIMMYLSQKTDAKIYGAEIQAHRYEVALKNIALNNLEERLSVYHTDIKTFNPKTVFDIIVSNPPFFKVTGETKRSVDMDMEIAKHELTLNLKDLVSSVRKHIKHGGLFFMVHKADRLEDIMLTLNENEFKVKRIRFVHPTESSEPNQVLIEARYKGNGSLTVMPPLFQYKGDAYSDEMKSIYEGRSYKL
ncbi:methyltransferase [Acholeplasma equirhinis]|uniref:tRNA1(Val) (adenine(37)-N6)-methyltransferase n=1 Tax=Acholeplasma equirhinis TaxID=555393 RepID=UPI00197AFE3C|nr:methyltransferase [Acholeplasma equirhinis]MBN3490913.1 methyltransferase [Acholeplasma equirhinis]